MAHAQWKSRPRKGVAKAWFNGSVHSLVLFAGLAVVVTLTPGPATALVVRNTLRGGRRAAFLTTLGNSTGVLAWGAASAAGIAALVAASEIAFLVLKVTGAVVLIVLGVQSWRRRSISAPERQATGRPLRDGIVTSLANPKLAVFFIAFFPQFLTGGRSTLGTGLLMATFIVVLDLVWYSVLALLVARLGHALRDGPWMRRLERLSGSAMVGLGVRVALETR
jgi:threonine/homoserine/homoserine lactone efflux protein